MLPVKTLKPHGMKNNHWPVRDKISLYRTILKLNGRDRKLRSIDAGRQRKRISRELKTLTAEVKEYRGILNEIVNGDRRRVHTLLQDHKDLQLAYDNHSPGEVVDAIDQDNCLKRRQLDKLCYDKRKKQKEFADKQLELTSLVDKCEFLSLEAEPDNDEQRLIALYQETQSNETAARTIHSTYRCLLKILESDRTYFDAFLKALKDDRIEQCTVLLRVTTMGQLAAEDLDDTRQKYKRMAIDVWKNMKERERNLKRARTQVENQWTHARSLVRVESDMDYSDALGRKKLGLEDELRRQISELDETFVRVKEAIRVRSNDELFTRFEEQLMKKERLAGEYKRSLEERNLWLNKKEHALLILANLEHSMITTTGQYKATKKETHEQIADQRKKEEKCEEERKSKGELLINIRTALLNMLGLLEVVKGRKSAFSGDDRRFSREVEKKTREKVKIDEIESDDERSMHSIKAEPLKKETVDTDALSLLSKVTQKMNTLFGMSHVDLDKESEEKATIMYQTYVANFQSRRKFGQAKPEPAELMMDHEVIDASVPTREDIKNRSQQVVEANTNYD